MARGFSLVEVLVALLVVFLLAAVLYGGVAGVGTWGRDRVSCTYGGLVQVYLADGARKELRSPQEYLQDLGLPWGSPPLVCLGSGWTAVGKDLGGVPLRAPSAGCGWMKREHFRWLPGGDKPFASTG